MIRKLFLSFEELVLLAGGWRCGRCGEFNSDDAFCCRRCGASR